LGWAGVYAMVFTAWSLFANGICFFTGCTLFCQRRALGNTTMKPYQFLLFVYVTLLAS
jgi:hypothetical protein